MEAETSDLRRQVAYLKGLSEGEGRGGGQKALQGLLQLVDELAKENEQLRLRQSELEGYVEAVDEDLNELELHIYEEVDDEEEEWDGEDVGYWGMECPRCKESVLVEEETLNDPVVTQVLCPACDEPLFVTEESEGEKASSPDGKRK